MSDVQGTGQRYRSIVKEVERECERYGRNPEEVLVVAVSKTVGVHDVALAMDAGALDFGENRPDQIVEKQAALPHARWHFIGNIQSRRIPDIVACAHLIHSVYKLDHLPKIDAAAKALGKVQDILIEVNSGEEAKGGIKAQDALDFVTTAAELPYIRVRGLMTMAPLGDLGAAEKSFAQLRELRDQLQSTSAVDKTVFTELSMGMSNDWPLAIAQGATIIRVGRAVFSEDFA